MKQNNKVSDIFGVICVAFVFAGCIIGDDGGVTILNVVFFAVALAAGLISKKTEVK